MFTDYVSTEYLLVAMITKRLKERVHSDFIVKIIAYRIQSMKDNVNEEDNDSKYVG